MSMVFNINKGATMPFLMMRLNNDGRTDYHKFYLAIQAADSVKFSMTNLDTGIKKIARADAEVVREENAGCEERYLLRYRWTERDTNEAGRFIGTFEINLSSNIVVDGLTFYDGRLIVPIEEDLVININDSMVKTLHT